MRLRAVAVLVSLALVGCTSETPSPNASPSASATVTATPSATVTATRSPSPTSTPPPPGPRCSVVRGSRAIGDDFNSSVAFVDGDTGVVAVGKKLYRTTDGGAHWRLVRTLPGDAWDVVAAGCRTMFVVYDGRGTTLDRSDDGGATWHPVASSLPPFRTLDFVTPRVGFALQTIPDEAGATLYKTYDGGATWRHIYGDTEVYSVAAAANGVTLAGLADGVALSLDGGASWRQVVRSERYVNARSRVWLGTDLRSAFALVHDAVGGRGYELYRTGRLTSSWDVVASYDGARKLGEHPSVLGGYGSSALMVGRFDAEGVATGTTRTGGASFYRGSVVPPDEEGGDVVYGVSGIAWPTATHAVVVVGADQAGVYRSLDAGATWRQVAFLEG